MHKKRKEHNLWCVNNVSHFFNSHTFKLLAYFWQVLSWPFFQYKIFPTNMNVSIIGQIRTIKPVNPSHHHLARGKNSNPSTYIFFVIKIKPSKWSYFFLGVRIMPQKKKKKLERLWSLSMRAPEDVLARNKTNTKKTLLGIHNTWKIKYCNKS